MKNNKGIKLKNTIKQHILNNKKPYILVALLFIIGNFLGVLFVNNIQEAQRIEINNYIKNFIEQLKTIEHLDQKTLIQTSLQQNIILAIAIWFFGTTVIGLPIVFGIVLYRGFCLGYAISVCVTTLGLPKGLIFVIITLILPNILFIPALLALAVSGFKLYKSIVKDKIRENIKLEILRHTVFCIIMLGILIFSSLVEIFISTNLLKTFIKYF